SKGCIVYDPEDVIQRIPSLCYDTKPRECLHIFYQINYFAYTQFPPLTKYVFHLHHSNSLRQPEVHDHDRMRIHNIKIIFIYQTDKKKHKSIDYFVLQISKNTIYLKK
ncbi:hypothetical protein BpHYR1_054564, partial [Brachionus plicatilis]